MNIAVAIAGLAFLILIHEAGHFFAARVVRMRPRKFYVFFPPVLVKPSGCKPPRSLWPTCGEP